MYAVTDDFGKNIVSHVTGADGPRSAVRQRRHGVAGVCQMIRAEGERLRCNVIITGCMSHGYMHPSADSLRDKCHGGGDLGRHGNQLDQTAGFFQKLIQKLDGWRNDICRILGALFSGAINGPSR